MNNSFEKLSSVSGLSHIYGLHILYYSHTHLNTFLVSKELLIVNQCCCCNISPCCNMWNKIIMWRDFQLEQDQQWYTSGKNFHKYEKSFNKNWSYSLLQRYEGSTVDFSTTIISLLTPSNLKPNTCTQIWQNHS